VVDEQADSEAIMAVKGWLKTKGYPLEYETARVFQDRNVRVTQGVAYTDLQTAEGREIDVMGDMSAATYRPEEDEA